MSEEVIEVGEPRGRSTRRVRHSKRVAHVPPVAVGLDAGGHAAAGQPTTVTVLDVVRRHPRLVVVPALVLLAIGLALGALRKPTYSSTARGAIEIGLSAGTALSGISEATPSYADTFSRAATSDWVLNAVAQTTGIGHDAITAAVSATPVAQSGGINIVATAPSPTRATRLVNAVAASLSAYVAGQANSAAAAAALLAQYQGTEGELQRLEGERSAENSAAVQALNEKASSLRVAYREAVTGPQIHFIVLNTASSASSDRLAKLALLGILGLVAGTAAGLTACAVKASLTRRGAHAS